jgi:A/G-specific adenine glycosylase
VAESDPVANTRPFSERLLEWWDEHGRRDLPWQQPRTPYRVWISEIMLQQTQVTTVIPYFERWMEIFPDIASLAGAPLDEVLSLWSGLGYYARARNLHRAAVLCMEQHAGLLPVSAEELSALPGIGLSTANAIISQSSDEPAAVLDGNVRRTFARHMAMEGWTGKASVQKQLWKAAEARLPRKRGADYTQAIMDLGALVCTRSGPACDACPVSEDCQAFKLDQVERFPWPKPPTRVSEKTMHMLILRDEQGRVLLERRPPTGIWGGLWSFPEGGSIESIEQNLGLSNTAATTLPQVEHRLSHVRMLIHPCLATAAVARQVKCSPQQKWIDPAERSKLGVPKPVSDLLADIHNGEFT